MRRRVEKTPEAIEVSAGLLLVRVVMQRMIQQILPDRILLFGCAVGIAAFLAGNWLGARGISPL